MIVLCFLDSTHYTDPEYVRLGDTTPESEVKAFVERKLREDMAWERGKSNTATLVWDEDGNRASCMDVFYDHGMEDRFFVTCEIKKLEDADYISAYHHAYDGVGFEVKGFDSIEKARENSKKWADSHKKTYPVYEEDYDLNFINLDLGNEWHMFTSQLIHETQVKKIDAAA